MNFIQKTTLAAFTAVTLLSAPIFSSYAGDHHKHHMHDQAKAIETDFTATIFEDAQAADKHIVIDVWKKGCPTCKAQHPTLQEARVKYPNAIFLKVNFETQKDVVKSFDVVKQSTIIVFNGTEETGRVLGETNQEKLLSLIATGV